MTDGVHVRGALLAALVGNVIFGFSFLFTRLALDVATVYMLLACRFGLAFLVMNGLLATRRVQVQFRGKPWRWLLVLGIFQPVLYFFGENYGVLYTSATFSSVMIALVPVVTTTLGVVFLRESVSRRQVAFSLLSVAGVGVITYAGGLGGSQLKGFFLLLLAVFSAAAFYLFTRGLSQVFSPFERTYMMFAVGCLCFIPLALGQTGGRLAPFAAALGQPVFVAAVVYLGVVSSVAAFLLINYANTYLPVSRTSVFTNVITIVSVAAGVLFLRETFSLRSFVGAGMILVGVWGVQRPATPAVDAPEEVNL